MRRCVRAELVNGKSWAASGRRGYTLVEIVIVIGVMALLAGLLLPALAAVRAAGRRTVCISNLQQLAQAMQLYATDYERYPRGVDPADKYTGMWNTSGSQAVVAQTPLLPEVMQSYIRSTEVWHCPSDTGFDVVDNAGYLLDARPGCFDKFGMSYFYRTELTVLNLAQEHLAQPEKINVLFDADGAWHGSGFLYWQEHRYNVQFADGHVKNVNRDELLADWSLPLR